MKPATRNALQGSINKWLKIALGTGADHGDINCPLCKRFKNPGAKGGNKHCRGCPVFAATGRVECMNTPYHNDWAHEGYPNYVVTAEQRNAALAELNFLISLLPLPKRTKR